MTILINASNTSGLTITSDTSGKIAFQSAGTTVATISGTGANAGIQMGAAFAPAFSAYASAAQSVTSNTDTKVTFDTETFDTNSNFASSRFTPTVAGYYQLNTTIRFNNNSNTQYIIYWYKNGASMGLAFNTNVNQGTGLITGASTLVYLNGSTDYMEVWISTTGTTPTIGSSNANTNYFSGFLARSA